MEKKFDKTSMKDRWVINDEKKHTQGKWSVCSGNAGEKFNIETDGTGNDLLPIATLKGCDRKANADFIITACNSYTPMLEALKKVLNRLNEKSERLELDLEDTPVYEAVLQAISQAEIR